MSPDPISFQATMLTDPQRFNLYSYVRNSPLTLTDPTGEAIVSAMRSPSCATQPVASLLSHERARDGSVGEVAWFGCGAGSERS